MRKKLFVLLVFLSFCGSIGFGADNYVSDLCYQTKYSFKDPFVQQYVDDYKVLLASYVEIFNTNDLEKIQNFTVLAQEFSKRAPNVMERLTDSEEAQKFSDKMSEMATCFSDEIEKFSY